MISDQAVGLAGKVDHSDSLSLRLPTPRLMPTALVAPDSRIVVTPVCSPQTLAEGRPRMGIACSQQDLTKVYALCDDAERCVADFLAVATEHAREFRGASGAPRGVGHGLANTLNGGIPRASGGYA